MNKYAAKLFRTSFFTVAGFLCSILLLPDLIHAASDISARYIQAQGNQIVIEITAGSNPPSSAILVQKFPSGVTMLSSHPGASNYDPKKNMAKWLFRNMRPGKSTVNMTLDRPVSGADISAELRYKPQQGGGMTTISIGK